MKGYAYPQSTFSFAVDVSGSNSIHVLYILFCLFVGCGGEIIGGGLEEEYVTAKSSQVLFTTGARLAGKMRIGIGLGSCRSCRG